MKSIAWKLMLAGLCLGLLGWAQDPNQDPNADIPDKPGPGVARVSFMNGEVSVRRGDSGELVAAALNAPMMVGDHLVTGPNGAAEIEFDYANAMRISANADIRITDLENQICQVQVGAGTATYRLRSESQVHPEIDTPSVSVRPVQPGSYRISVDADGQSMITVRAGDADIYTPQGSQHMNAGSTMYARGPAANPEFRIAGGIPQDDWDKWNVDRDHRMEQSKSYKYVNRDITGAQDLDANGRWVWTPDYGWVWTPTVQPGWAPYRDGRWAWEDYYGWTWVGYEPWGWAPYHYGRWFNGPVGWCWSPGPIYGHHFWRPALVGFFGFGPGIGVGFGFGNIGWVPLAPFEAFRPWYGGRGLGRGGFGRVNIVNNVNIVNTYRNARVANAVSGTGLNHFGSGGAGRITPVSSALMRQAGSVRGVLPVSPNSNSLRFSDRQPAANRTAARATNFASYHQPAQSTRVPFQQQQRSVEQSIRSYGTTAGARSGVAASGSAPAATRGGAAATGTWRQLGQQSNAGTGRAAQAAPSAAGSNAAVWQRFEQRGAAGRSQAAPSTGSGPSRGYARPSSPSYGTSSPSYGSRGSAVQGPVHVSPPIVRDRPAAPQYGVSSGRPQYSAPAPQSRGGSAPSSGSFGHSSGGGGSHSTSSSSSHSSGGRR